MLTRTKIRAVDLIKVRKNATTLPQNDIRDLAGIRRRRSQKYRKKRPMRQRDGLTHHDRTFGNTARQDVEAFLNRLRRIRGQEQIITWKQDGPGEQWGIAYTYGKVKFNHYEKNNTMPENP